VYKYNGQSHHSYYQPLVMGQTQHLKHWKLIPRSQMIARENFNAFSRQESLKCNRVQFIMPRIVFILYHIKENLAYSLTPNSSSWQCPECVNYRTKYLLYL
jgi:hypothetical protein